MFVLIPLELYDAFQYQLDANPMVVDPTTWSGENGRFTWTQMHMIAAFMKLELGIDTDEITAELDRRQIQESMRLYDEDELKTESEKCETLEHQTQYHLEDMCRIGHARIDASGRYELTPDGRNFYEKIKRQLCDIPW